MRQSSTPNMSYGAATSSAALLRESGSCGQGLWHATEMSSGAAVNTEASGSESEEREGTVGGVQIMETNPVATTGLTFHRMA